MQTAFVRAIQKVNRKVSNAIDCLAGYMTIVLCSVMTFVVLLGVFYRYVLTDPLAWSEELSTFAMVWLTMIGGSMGIKRYSHVGVSYVIDNVFILTKNRNAIGVVVNVLILLFLAILLKEGQNLALFASNQTSTALGVSMFWPYCGLLVGGWMMLLQVVSQIVEGLTGGAEKFVDDCCLGESV